MEEAPENGKESSNSTHANGMNEWINDWYIDKIAIKINYDQRLKK